MNIDWDTTQPEFVLSNFISLKRKYQSDANVEASSTQSKKIRTHYYVDEFLANTTKKTCSQQ